MFNLKKRTLRGDLVGVYKYLMADIRKDKARLSVVACDWTRGKNPQ